MGTVLAFKSEESEESRDPIRDHENFKPRISENIDNTPIDPSLFGHTSVADNYNTGYSRISLFDLYPLSDELRPELSIAFNLLKEGTQHLSYAIEMQATGDIISSDDAVHRLQALLPELFCCRSISDGFGSIINAVYHSITNMNGNPLNMRQLSAIIGVINRVSTEPFLEFNEAVDEVMTLEDVGFEVEPSYYAYAADMLDE